MYLIPSLTFPITAFNPSFNVVFAVSGVPSALFNAVIVGANGVPFSSVSTPNLFNTSFIWLPLIASLEFASILPFAILDNLLGVVVLPSAFTTLNSGFVTGVPVTPVFIFPSAPTWSAG